MDDRNSVSGCPCCNQLSTPDPAAGVCVDCLRQGWAARKQMADALTDAKATLAVAIEAGLDGFSAAEVKEILTTHVTMRRIDAALAAYRPVPVSQE